MKKKLTKAAVRNAQPRPGKQTFLWDTEQLGFGLRITPAGVKSYVFNYSLPGWRSPRRLTIGRIDALTLDQARRKARRWREQVLTGQDPAEVVEEERNLPSVGELVKRFLEEHVARKLRSSTERGYRQALGALPHRFHQLKVADVTGDDVAKLHASMHDKPYQANRTVAILRKMFSLAERWGMRPRGSNPAVGHDPYPERTDRGTRVTDAALARVGEALRSFDKEGSFDPGSVDLLRLNLYTGWRPLEVRTLRWEDVDLDRRVVTLRAAKTGTRSGFLGEPAARVLREAFRLEGNPYCFPGRKKGQHMGYPQRLWARLKEAAELPPEIRLYDLVRHTYNTVAQEAGVPPEMVQVLVGHVPSTISARYTHYALERTLKAADIAAGQLARLLGEERGRIHAGSGQTGGSTFDIPIL